MCVSLPSIGRNIRPAPVSMSMLPSITQDISCNITTANRDSPLVQQWVVFSEWKILNFIPNSDCHIQSNKPHPLSHMAWCRRMGSLVGACPGTWSPIPWQELGAKAVAAAGQEWSHLDMMTPWITTRKFVWPYNHYNTETNLQSFHCIGVVRVIMKISVGSTAITTCEWIGKLWAILTSTSAATKESLCSLRNSHPSKTWKQKSNQQDTSFERDCRVKPYC